MAISGHKRLATLQQYLTPGPERRRRADGRQRPDPAAANRDLAGPYPPRTLHGRVPAGRAVNRLPGWYVPASDLSPCRIEGGGALRGKAG